MLISLLQLASYLLILHNDPVSIFNLAHLSEHHSGDTLMNESKIFLKGPVISNLSYSKKIDNHVPNVALKCRSLKSIQSPLL